LLLFILVLKYFVAFLSYLFFRLFCIESGALEFQSDLSSFHRYFQGPDGDVFQVLDDIDRPISPSIVRNDILPFNFIIKVNHQFSN